MNKNIVEFGCSEFHVGTYDVADDGTVTLGTPLAILGARSLNLEPEGEATKVYADNKVYWSTFTDNGFSGSMDALLFSDAFKTQFLGYLTLDDGGVAAQKGIGKRKSVYIAFESEGDAENRRGILYNVTLGGIKREYKTREDKIEEAVESIDITVVGDNKTNLTLVGYDEAATGYATLFQTPPVPKLPTKL